MDETASAAADNIHESINTTLFGLLSHLDAETLSGSLAGAVIFVLSASDFTIAKRLILGSVALFSGYLAAPDVADIIKSLLPGSVPVNNGIGATFAAATIVRLLLLVSEKDGLFFIFSKQGKK